MRYAESFLERIGRTLMHQMSELNEAGVIEVLLTDKAFDALEYHLKGDPKGHESTYPWANEINFATQHGSIVARRQNLRKLPHEYERE